jgi:hypothetical protein
VDSGVRERQPETVHPEVFNARARDRAALPQPMTIKGLRMGSKGLHKLQEVAGDRRNDADFPGGRAREGEDVSVKKETPGLANPFLKDLRG